MTTKYIQAIYLKKISVGAEEGGDKDFAGAVGGLQQKYFHSKNVSFLQRVEQTIFAAPVSGV